MPKQVTWDFSDINNAVSGIARYARQQDTQRPAGAEPISRDDLYGYLGPTGAAGGQAAPNAGVSSYRPPVQQDPMPPQTIAGLWPTGQGQGAVMAPQPPTGVAQPQTIANLAVQPLFVRRGA